MGKKKAKGSKKPGKKKAPAPGHEPASSEDGGRNSRRLAEHTEDGEGQFAQFAVEEFLVSLLNGQRRALNLGEEPKLQKWSKRRDFIKKDGRINPGLYVQSEDGRAKVAVATAPGRALLGGSASASAPGATEHSRLSALVSGTPLLSLNVPEAAVVGALAREFRRMVVSEKYSKFMAEIWNSEQAGMEGPYVPEPESVQYTATCKLYRWEKGTKGAKEEGWKERGLGEMQLLKDPITSKSRILMRSEKDPVGVCCSQVVTSTSEMEFYENQPKQVTWKSTDVFRADDSAEHHALDPARVWRFLLVCAIPETAMLFKHVYQSAAKEDSRSNKPTSPTPGAVVPPEGWVPKYGMPSPELARVAKDPAIAAVYNVLPKDKKGLIWTFGATWAVAPKGPALLHSPTPSCGKAMSTVAELIDHVQVRAKEFQNAWEPPDQTWTAMDRGHRKHPAEGEILKHYPSVRNFRLVLGRVTNDNVVLMHLSRGTNCPIAGNDAGTPPTAPLDFSRVRASIDPANGKRTLQMDFPVGNGKNVLPYQGVYFKVDSPVLAERGSNKVPTEGGSFEGFTRARATGADGAQNAEYNLYKLPEDLQSDVHVLMQADARGDETARATAAIKTVRSRYTEYHMCVERECLLKWAIAQLDELVAAIVSNGDILATVAPDGGFAASDGGFGAKGVCDESGAKQLFATKAEAQHAWCKKQFGDKWYSDTAAPDRLRAANNKVTLEVTLKSASKIIDENFANADSDNRAAQLTKLLYFFTDIRRALFFEHANVLSALIRDSEGFLNKHDSAGAAYKLGLEPVQVASSRRLAKAEIAQRQELKDLFETQILLIDKLSEDIQVALDAYVGSKPTGTTRSADPRLCVELIKRAVKFVTAQRAEWVDRCRSFARCKQLVMDRLKAAAEASLDTAATAQASMIMADAAKDALRQEMCRLSRDEEQDCKKAAEAVALELIDAEALKGQGKPGTRESARAPGELSKKEKKRRARDKRAQELAQATSAETGTGPEHDDDDDDDDAIPSEVQQLEKYVATANQSAAAALAVPPSSNRAAGRPGSDLGIQAELPPVAWTSSEDEGDDDDPAETSNYRSRLEAYYNHHSPGTWLTAVCDAQVRRCVATNGTDWLGSTELKSKYGQSFAEFEFQAANPVRTGLDDGDFDDPAPCSVASLSSAMELALDAEVASVKPVEYTGPYADPRDDPVAIAAVAAQAQAFISRMASTTSAEGMRALEAALLSEDHPMRKNGSALTAAEFDRNTEILANTFKSVLGDSTAPPMEKKDQKFPASIPKELLPAAHATEPDLGRLSGRALRDVAILRRAGSAIPPALAVAALAEEAAVVAELAKNPGGMPSDLDDLFMIKQTGVVMTKMQAFESGYSKYDCVSVSGLAQETRVSLGAAEEAAFSDAVELANAAAKIDASITTLASNHKKTNIIIDQMTVTAVEVVTKALQERGVELKTKLTQDVTAQLLLLQETLTKLQTQHTLSLGSAEAAKAAIRQSDRDLVGTRHDMKRCSDIIEQAMGVRTAHDEMHFAAPPPLALDGSPPCRFDMWGLRDAAAAFGVIDSDKPPCEDLTRAAPGVPGDEIVPGHAREDTKPAPGPARLPGDPDSTPPQLSKD